MSFEIPKNAKKVEGVSAPMPYLRSGKPYNSFVALRAEVVKETGRDFLAVCGDLMRPANFHSTKPGVAERSWHKTGRAFDYNQADPNYVLVPETINGRQYWRTWIRCAEQDGSQGTDLVLISDFMGRKSGHYWDFTEAALRHGYHRIPAWRDWTRTGSGSNKREFWHYQNDTADNGETLSWDGAMRDLTTGAHIADQRPRILGRNDRGDDVRRLQSLLSARGFLPAKEIDGTFGNVTATAVEKFQDANHLTVDGIVGPATAQALGFKG